MLWGFGILGVLWAGVPWAERLASLNSFQKLFMVPFLALQFRDSHRGMWVLIGFLISSTVLLIISWGLILLPDLAWRGRERMIGVPVKDYISQNAIFTLCIIGLAEGAFFAWQKGSRRSSLALVLLAIAFFANILYASVSRTALVALPTLLLLFAFRRFGWKSAAGLLIAMMMFFGGGLANLSAVARAPYRIVRRDPRSSTSSSFFPRRAKDGVLAKVPGHHLPGAGVRPRHWFNTPAVRAAGGWTHRHGRACFG